MKYDIVIIGGGIVGLASAMALSENRKLKIAVIEAETSLAKHQTGNNSGVIHSGLYYKPGSLKAQNCVEGREKMYRFCEENNIPVERCGKLVSAVSKEELSQLEMLRERGEANGIKGIKKLSDREINEYEPHATGLAGLLIPDTGIVDYTDVCEVMARIIRQRGNEIFLGTRFTGIKKFNDGITLRTTKNDFLAKNIINCSGLYSDRVARACGVNPDVKIVPFRGEYYELKKEKHHLVKNLIYPVPDPAFPFLGVHFTRMIKGGVEAGPNAVLAFKREGYSKTSFSLRDTIDTFTYPGFLKLAGKFISMGLEEYYRSLFKKVFVKAMQKLIPEINENDIKSGGAGVRAQALGKNGSLVDDFYIVERPNMIHILNAPSPAATAAISIGEKISKMAAENFNLN
ncbi:MAG: L-2-hydroxyglutarate oxidase [Calditrichaeota bacterium]|nr:MAG: L-2-hydroxyglutarate oxidase [Calditrichota bacterium]